MFWCLKIAADSGNIYWLTANKNNDGNTFTFYDGAAPLTYDSSILAKSINGREATPISEIEQSIDLSLGGEIGSFSDMNFTCLNQHRLDETLTPLNLENRATSLLMGFVPDGASPTVLIADMITLWTGVLSRIDYDADELRISLRDDIEKKHRNIPQTIIDKNDYPRAPEESIGQPLPILYGDFDTDSNTEPYIYYGTYNLAPLICIDKALNKFIIAGHITHTAPSLTGGNFSACFFYEGSMKVPAMVFYQKIGGTLGNPTYSANDSGLSTLLIPSGPIIGRIYIPASRAGVNNNVTDYQNAMDGSSSTYASVANSGSKKLEFMLDGLPSVPAPPAGTQTFMFFIFDVAIASVLSFRCRRSGGAEYDLTLADLYGEQYIGDNTFTNSQELDQYTWSFYENPDQAPAAETAKVKAIGIRFYFLISSGITYERARRQAPSNNRRVR
jgi:hypothetical protein